METATATMEGADDEARDVSPAARRLTPRGILQWCCYAFPAVLFLATGWAHRSMTEDGFIYLRVVRQFRAGNGPVFNSGERVEAATGTLWVWLLSIADLLTPVRLEWIAVIAGLACGVAGLCLAMAGARRLWIGDLEQPFFVPLGALVFIAVLPVWIYATSGLETGLSFAWLGACLWVLADWARGPHRRLSSPRAILLGLGWLVRPELVLFSAMFFVLVIALDWPHTNWRSRARVAVAMLALPVAYQVFRMGYYGSIIPNTAIAKEGDSANWGRGWRYFWDFVRPYGLWFAALAMIAGGFLPLAAALARARARRSLCVVAAFALGAVLSVLYMIAVGGDYQHGRLLLPALFALCAPVAVVPLIRQTMVGLVVVPWAIAAAFVLRPPQYTTDNFLANGVVVPRASGFVTTGDFGYAEGDRMTRWYHGPAYYYQKNVLAYPSPDIPLADRVDLPVGAFFGVGISGYAVGTDFDVIDLLGLADTLAAHMEAQPVTLPGAKRYAGHEKPLPSPWLAARLTAAGSRPDPADFPDFEVPLIPTTEGREWQEQVAWARAALRCDGIEEIIRAANAPMTPRRFVHNFLHSFSSTRTRIPPDPETAYREFCGPGVPEEVRALAPE